jgi:hypothetical protein
VNHDQITIAGLVKEDNDRHDFPQIQPARTLALEVETRQVIAFYVGDRSPKSARKLWDRIPREIARP